MENRNLRLTFFFFVLLIIVSCKRKEIIGNGLVPDSQNSNIIYCDTLTLRTRTVVEDSIITSDLSYNILGTSNNSVFNLSHANVEAQYFLPRDNFSFGGATKFDSAVLYIGFLAADGSEGNRSYGDMTSPQRFTVHELSDGLDPLRAYYNNSFVSYDALGLGAFNGKVNLNDSIPIVLGSTAGKIPPCLRIKLDNNWAKAKLFNAPATAFSTNGDFLKYFKGLAIISEYGLAGNGGFVYVNLKQVNRFNLPTGSALVIYYNDSLSTSFTVGNAARRVNTYNHFMVTTPPFPKPQDYANYGGYFNPDTCFIQAMGRYKMKIEIPYLYELAKKYKNIAINDAELILKPYPSGLTADYYAPTSLRLLQPSALDGRNDFIKDILYLGSTPINPFYGGNYNISTNEYRFNFKLHLQELLNDYKATGSTSKNRGLFVIVPTDNPIAASHVILNTKKDGPDAGIKVKIYYTIQN